MTSNTSELPTHDAMMNLLKRVLPGTSASMAKVRRLVIEFSGSMTSKAVLLRGPIGSGKSTIARLIGLMKRVAPLTNAEATRILTDAQFEDHNRLDLRYIPWYVELALTGLVEGLADSQLFGSMKGAYTGALIDRPGVFELASTGRVKRGNELVGAKLTGGVVFLDEVGDLSLALQAKLLPALSGGAFYRVGGEGREDQEVRFRGVTITASWRKLDAGVLRPDLLSRISSNIIDVPGLDERREDFDAVFDEIQSSIIEATRRAIHSAIREEQFIDRTYWLAKTVEIGPVSENVRREFSRIDWGRFGNLRGLSAALERVISGGAAAETVLDELPPVLDAQLGSEPAGGSDLVAALLRRSSSGTGLIGNVKAIEVENRSQLKERLGIDVSIRRQLAKQLGLTDEQLLAAVHQLDRRRLKAPEKGK